MPSKFVVGELILNGSRIKNMVEFTPVNLQWDDLDFDNLATKFTTFNNFKLRETNGMLKIQGPLEAGTMAQFWDVNNIFELMSTNVYSEVDETTMLQAEAGHYEIMRVQFGGVAPQARTNGDGGDMEIPFKIISMTMKDRYNQETFYHNVVTNALRLNGVDKRTASNQILGI
jgi:hypothetical protein